jgi:hypothetical protein
MKVRVTLLILTILASTLTAAAHDAKAPVQSQPGVTAFARIKSPDYLRVGAGLKHSNDPDELRSEGVPEWRIRAAQVAMSTAGSDVHECSICGCYMLNHFFLCTMTTIGPLCFTWPTPHTCTLFIAD